ncbi:MAG: nucleotidyl transferase AbiEii/AbiGii toxin family protein [Deltaproteobacteria bacterium]|nr:nucleotidyl transferase AbiEii/AbiGii toxin family protein [Deltaproteobacteria bacterium]
MIDKREILETASALGLLPSIVEKDYVLGWLLAGINAHPDLADAWVFKGGTCLKKCYFETYRFSEDLDFTLRDERQLEEGFLRRVLGEVVTWVAEESGLAVPAEQLGFDFYQNPRGRLSCQGRIGCRGPVSPTSGAGGWPKIKLDLTADEKLVLPAVRREVFHPYSDRPKDGLWINSYAYEEAFGEKVRALGERTRPRDLYDVVNLYRHGDSRPSPAVLRDVLAQKCAYKGIALPTFEALQPHRADLEAMWANMLGHQLPMLPPVADFWAALPDIFAWIVGGVEAPQRARIEPASADIAIRSRVLPMGVPLRARAPLEIIRFAAANQLCVDLTYDGNVRRIEPYSLRQTAEGNFVLHAIRSDSGEHRSYRVDRMQGASVTGQSFAPRYLVELTSEGPLPVAPAASRPSTGGRESSGSWTSPRPRRAAPSRGTSPGYVYRCTVCRKTFERKSMDGSLNPHKHPRGYECPGRIGTYVRTKY